MSKFKVGDRVKYRGEHSPFKNKFGTVVGVESLYDPAFRTKQEYVGVRFDKKIDCAHTLHGKCENNHGWWCCGNELELINDEPRFNVIITSVGDVTTAKLLHGKKVEKEVSVKRYFKDEYSEKEAVKNVCAKLFGEDKPEKKPEPKGINCKAVYIGDEGLGFTRGKVYKFSDGKCVDDDGDFYPIYVGYKITNFDDGYFAIYFVKLVDTDE